MSLPTKMSPFLPFFHGNPKGNWKSPDKMAKMQLFAIFGVETGFYSSNEGLSRYNVFMQGVYEEWLVL